MVKKLMSLEGIGLITAVTMRAEIARFDRFDSGKQLSRYCGVTPRNASSGTKQADAGLVRAGQLEPANHSHSSGSAASQLQRHLARICAAFASQRETKKCDRGCGGESLAAAFIS